MKAAAFFFAGLVMVMGVVGGIENTIDIGFVQALQYLGVTLAGFALMALGTAYQEQP